MIKFGIDRLIEDADLRRPLAGKRVALLAHPASVTHDLVHSLDALSALEDINLTAAFGPQHGLRGDKQDNMIESPDYNDPVHEIPVFSLYGEVRRPTGQSMSTFDVVLIDLQDLGCRIYTFIHGLTMGEMGRWMVSHFNLDVDYKVIEMQGWQPDGAGFGWPEDRVWINPSPNAANVNMARAYAGTVMLEGTTLSEGRGTTRPLELFGAPDIDARAVIAEMRQMGPQWLEGCALREIWFEPTFHKHQGKLCNGVQIHAEGPFYDHHVFRPWRLQALALKAIGTLCPGYELWRDFPYEYEEGRLAFDVINGGPSLRNWIENPSSTTDDLEAIADPDEQKWSAMLSDYLLY